MRETRWNWLLKLLCMKPFGVIDCDSASHPCTGILSVSLIHSLHLSVCVHVRHPVYLSSKLCLSARLSASLSQSVRPSLRLSRCLSLSLSLPVALSLSLGPAACPSLSLSSSVCPRPLCQDYMASGWPTWTPVVGKQNVPLGTKPL